MNTILKNGLIVATLAFAICHFTACGNEEEKKIKIEDTTPPVISNVKVFDITDTSAQISWETDEPAKGEVIWELTEKPSKNPNWIIHEELNTTHSFKITDLSPSTTYYYRVASADANNNWKVSETSSFTTLAK